MMLKSGFLLCTLALCCSLWGAAPAADRWQIAADGKGIEWPVASDASLPHEDFLEMSGLAVSSIIGYGADGSRNLNLWQRKIVWPQIRTQPNNTHASLMQDFGDKDVPYLKIDGRRIHELVEKITFDGVLAIEARVPEGNVRSVRRIFPSASRPVSYELVELTNHGDKPLTVSAQAKEPAAVRLCCTGRYMPRARVAPSEAVTLAPGETKAWTIAFTAGRVDADAGLAPSAGDGPAELAARRTRLRELTDPVVLETGVPVLDTMFHLAKIRAGESIFQTRGGLMHGPGGGSYYAATWCNDQVEYAGPWFAFTGDAVAAEASLNAYEGYMAFMGPDYAPIPCSIIAEGFDYWNGAGDRGDAAMWAYGATRFVLASGRRDWAERLWPGIRWTLEYCKRRLNASGVVASERDELEGRLPSGKANLCTSTLYYDALVHASRLARELGDTAQADDYAARLEPLRAAIEAYFGAEIHGFKTYRYYEDCKILRSWIGIPLCMGLGERAAGTAEAIFSPYLRTASAGLLSAEGDKHGTTWDRSQLYAYRGLLACGVAAPTLDDLQSYSRARLLGAHVPYAVEAWPEGDRRHLSAESALYCRIFTEGLFGLDPTGLGTCAAKPHLPPGWKRMALRNVHACGRVFDVEVDASGTKICARAGR